MALRDVLSRGFSLLLSEGADEFQRYLESRSIPSEIIPSLGEAVCAVPDLLVEIDRVTRDESAPMAARVLFPVVISYLLAEDDKIPRRAGLILGVLDDAYLVHRVVSDVAQAVPGAKIARSSVHLATLRAALPDDVASSLDALVDNTISAATTKTEQLGL